MFCVVYQWKVLPGKEDEFRETWRTLTEAIFRQHGSLGSRMHRNEDGTWVAYAQWPDKQHWENHAETLAVALARSRQHACLAEEPKVLFKLTVTDDLLRTAPYDARAENLLTVESSQSPSATKSVDDGDRENPKRVGINT